MRGAEEEEEEEEEEKELQWTRKLNFYMNDVSRISWINNMTNLAFWVKE